MIDAKKEAIDFKYKNQSIYINDHLSRFNRGLFAAASDAKRKLQFKYLWVKNGQIFMRLNDRSPLIKICKEVDIANLAIT